MDEAERSSQVVVASPWLRLSAFLIDAAVLAVVNLAVAASTGDIEVSQRNTFALIFVTTVVYHVGFVAWRGATPGKMAVGITIAYQDGKAVRPDTAILRYLVLLVGNMFVVGALVSLVLIITDPQRRALHDRVAGTLVRKGGRAAGESESQPDRFPRL